MDLNLPGLAYVNKKYFKKIQKGLLHEMDKIKEILKKMTFEQKAAMLTGKGSYTTGFEELQVPSVHVIDGPNGIRKGKYIKEGGGVCIPCAALLGASWDKNAVFFAGKVLGADCINENEALLLAPGVNMKRTPYCGRNFEYYSEDPVLSGELGAAFINGLDSMGIGASLKHYAMNNQELDRVFINADVDERTMREYYLKVFEIVLKNSKPDMVMNSYNKVCGIWASENKYLLTDILRGEFKFEGLVISDWGSVHDISKSVHAGLDLQMPYNKDIEAQLKQGLEKGTVTMEDIDRAVTNVLKFVFKRADKKEDLGNIRSKQHENARKLAAEGMVLLKNDDNALPVSGKKYKKLAVYGQHAEKPVICGSGSARMTIPEKYTDAPIDFIRQYAMEENIELTYAALNDEKYIGAEIVGSINSMKKNDVDLIIVFAGDNYGAETETEYWDRDSLILPNYINGMIRSACEACDNVVVVFNTASAVVPLRWQDEIKGAVTMWYPGEGGGKAIADILFGKTNPSGKLSETFALKAREDMDVCGDKYKTWYKEGMFAGYRYYDEHPEEVWFPFGHGLSYTSFEYSDMKLSKNFSDREEDSFTVSFKVKNTGGIFGKETVQLYIGQINSIVTRPKKELKRFEKLGLEPGEEKTVEFTVSHCDLAYYNICLKQWHTESGTYEIMAGASAGDIRLKEQYKIKYDSDYTIGAPKGRLTMA